MNEQIRERIESPLKVEVSNGMLVISIGIDTLAWASIATNGGPLTKERVDKRKLREWAKDVGHEMTDENGIGETPLSTFMDHMITKAAENGSAALIYPKRQTRRAISPK